MRKNASGKYTVMTKAELDRDNAAFKRAVDREVARQERAIARRGRDLMSTTTDTKCDRKGCNNKAAWAYTINTLDGLEQWNSCQPHVKEVRKMHGMNIQKVQPIR